MANEEIIELYTKLDSTTNIMRGICFDPHLAEHIKGALKSEIEVNDKLLEKYLAQIEEM